MTTLKKAKNRDSLVPNSTDYLDSEIASRLIQQEEARVQRVVPTLRQRTSLRTFSWEKTDAQ